MTEVRVIRDGSGERVASCVAVADSWWRRARGLLGRKPLEPEQGLLLMECASVHTAGMGYAIDIAFLDADGQVVGSISRLGPWRIGVGGPKAVHTLELSAGRLDETGTTTGDRLMWS